MHESKKEKYYGNYIGEDRWISYFHQIDLVRKLKPKSILEVGPGPKVVYDHLKKIGYRIESVDISEEVNPDHIGDVRALPFPDSSYDLIMACQVLEHIPFGHCERAIKELWRVSQRFCVISLPYSSFRFAILLKLPRVGDLKGILRIPRPLRFIENPEHKWEIGWRGFSVRRVRNVIRAPGFEIIEERTPIQNLYHHFFVLAKRKIL